MTSSAGILRQLRSRAKPANVAGMNRFGMTTKKRLGISMPELRRIAKQTGTDHTAAMRLWKTGIPEARIVASMIADPALMTSNEMDRWAADLDSWDVCDQVCMNLFEKTRFASEKITESSRREEEFVKRAAFALIACLAWHDKELPDRKFIRSLKIIKRASTDDRNFVKKAVNWALRGIGKRNLRLNRMAIKTAHEIRALDSRASRWIAADAIRELESPGIRKRLRT